MYRLLIQKLRELPLFAGRLAFQARHHQLRWNSDASGHHVLLSQAARQEALQSHKEVHEAALGVVEELCDNICKWQRPAEPIERGLSLREVQLM
jgi:hypothetical protein